MHAIFVNLRKTLVFLRRFVKPVLLINKFGLINKKQLDYKMVNNYCCCKCTKVVQSESMPEANDFDCAKGGFHFWMDLGVIGSINYHCEKCGIKVSSNFIPTLFGCGLNGYHHWARSLELKNPAA
jgi:hypothetical protein